MGVRSSPILVRRSFESRLAFRSTLEQHVAVPEWMFKRPTRIVCVWYGFSLGTSETVPCRYCGEGGDGHPFWKMSVSSSDALH